MNVRTMSSSSCSSSSFLSSCTSPSSLPILHPSNSSSSVKKKKAAMKKLKTKKKNITNNNAIPVSRSPSSKSSFSRMTRRMMKARRLKSNSTTNTEKSSTPTGTDMNEISNMNRNKQQTSPLFNSKRKLFHNKNTIGSTHTRRNNDSNIDIMINNDNNGDDGDSDSNNNNVNNNNKNNKKVSLLSASAVKKLLTIIDKKRKKSKKIDEKMNNASITTTLDEKELTSLVQEVILKEIEKKRKKKNCTKNPSTSSTDDLDDSQLQQTVIFFMKLLVQQQEKEQQKQQKQFQKGRKEYATTNDDIPSVISPEEKKADISSLHSCHNESLSANNIIVATNEHHPNNTSNLSPIFINNEDTHLVTDNCWNQIVNNNNNNNNDDGDGEDAGIEYTIEDLQTVIKKDGLDNKSSNTRTKFGNVLDKVVSAIFSDDKNQDNPDSMISFDSTLSEIVGGANASANLNVSLTSDINLSDLVLEKHNSADSSSSKQSLSKLLNRSEDEITVFDDNESDEKRSDVAVAKTQSSVIPTIQRSKSSADSIPNVEKEQKELCQEPKQPKQQEHKKDNQERQLESYFDTIFGSFRNAELSCTEESFSSSFFESTFFEGATSLFPTLTAPSSKNEEKDKPSIRGVMKTTIGVDNNKKKTVTPKEKEKEIVLDEIQQVEIDENKGLKTTESRKGEILDKFPLKNSLETNNYDSPNHHNKEDGNKDDTKDTNPSELSFTEFVDSRRKERKDNECEGKDKKETRISSIAAKKSLNRTKEEEEEEEDSPYDESFTEFVDSRKDKYVEWEQGWNKENIIPSNIVVERKPSSQSTDSPQSNKLRIKQTTSVLGNAGKIQQPPSLSPLLKDGDSVKSKKESSTLSSPSSTVLAERQQLTKKNKGIPSGNNTDSTNNKTQNHYQGEAKEDELKLLSSLPLSDESTSNEKDFSSVTPESNTIFVSKDKSNLPIQIASTPQKSNLTSATYAKKKKKNPEEQSEFFFCGSILEEGEEEEQDDDNNNNLGQPFVRRRINYENMGSSNNKKSYTTKANEFTERISNSFPQKWDFSQKWGLSQKWEFFNCNNYDTTISTDTTVDTKRKTTTINNSSVLRKNKSMENHNNNSKEVDTKAISPTCVREASSDFFPQSWKAGTLFA